MREIVLDTETTGISPNDGHRLVEIGCLELFNHVATGKTFHTYVDPERDMPEGAFKVHGLSEEFLRGKPKFADIVDEFLAFIGDDPLVIHNASFDMGFLNAELKKIGRTALPMARAIDTLDIARRKYPGAQNNLDALCRRFGVDNSGRTKHGALLDSELLAEVYLEMMGGRQPGLVLQADFGGPAAQKTARTPRPAPLPSRLTDAEREAHDAFIASLGGEPLWTAQTTD
ncbi:DNA polymerase III subunit epsilon [Parvibaculum sp.]|jgi:DNA polymerase-3 subunit epsilon|uniref:DNA polymerase III subunit epsilon n=1 Tax=Parvibaculum sp. TaxID=2024848 RepID=UPI001B214106|nr:DNA polymerase III subunit epsilon [Parvibaculum sp.]MBO6634653.1 DNA polymerase III subunit epsilon [Parvibaculum sp.]MBO6677472.1 DNA polymerase III subunit epsilon [Parvibaculum sp.]MBO6685071.1 DNA polymerase III subunit epsilon [Parvibaculum sp.]MBO6903434.1 DNA polymerase III subunit epsilon [Parvibaculum sp.]